MSADVALPGERHQVQADEQDVLHRAVDMWDTVAHFEAGGRGDALARAEGHSDIFAHTAALIDDLGFRFAGPRMPRPLSLRHNMTEALRRVIVMVSGAIVCLAAIPAQAGEWTVFWAGAAGWLSGQAVSAAAWHGLGTGERHAAAKAAVVVTVACLAIGLMGTLILSAPAVFLWSAWGSFASVVVILRPSGRLHWRLLLAAAEVLFLQAVHAELLASCLSVTVIVAAGAAAAAAVRSELRDRVTTTAAGMWGAVCLAALQTVGQVTVLGILVVVVGSPGFYAVAVAGLVAGAAADPLLEIGYAAVRRTVNNPMSWRRGRIATAMIGVGSMTMIVLAGMAAVGVLLHGRGPSLQLWELTLSAIVLTSALTGGTGTLLRGGSAIGAALVAIGTALATLTLLLPYFSGGATVLVLVVLSFVVLLVMSGIAAVRMSHPSSW